MTAGNCHRVPERIRYRPDGQQQLELADLPDRDPFDDQADTEPSPPPSRPPEDTMPDSPESMALADTVPPPDCNEPPMPERWEGGP